MTPGVVPTFLVLCVLLVVAYTSIRSDHRGAEQKQEGRTLNEAGVNAAPSSPPLGRPRNGHQLHLSQLVRTVVHIAAHMTRWLFRGKRLRSHDEDIEMGLISPPSSIRVRQRVFSSPPPQMIPYKTAHAPAPAPAPATTRTRHEACNVKICDFGLARLRVCGGGASFTTRVGTIAWIAPKVLSGNTYDYRVDIYSLGICLWESVLMKTSLLSTSSSMWSRANGLRCYSRGYFRHAGRASRRGVLPSPRSSTRFCLRPFLECDIEEKKK